jgi:hypothetical protein
MIAGSIFCESLGHQDIHRKLKSLIFYESLDHQDIHRKLKSLFTPSGSSNILKNLMDDTDVITTAQLEARKTHEKSVLYCQHIHARSRHMFQIDWIDPCYLGVI